MATFFTSRVDALKLLDGTNTIVIGSVSEVGVVGAGVKVFDPLTGKAWTASANAYPTGWTEETETLPTATTEGSILRYDADTSSWVTTDLITVDPADDGTPTFRIGKSGSALTGLQLMETGGGIAVISYNATGTKVTIDKNVDVTGTITASSSVTGTAVTATTGNITATAGGVQAGGGTLTAGTTATTAGTIVVYSTAGATGVELSSSAEDTLKVGNGSNDGIIGNLADPTTANQASNKQYVDAEDAFLRTFTGKTAAGSENPTYSNTNYVTQSVSLEAAIGELDGDVFSAISALSSGVAWKGVARIITGSGVAGSIDLSSAGNSPVALPGTGTDYFVDDNTPTQTLIGQDTIAVNEYILYAGAGTDLLWKRVGTNLVVQSAPATSDTYGVLVDLVQTSDVLENNAAIYTYNSSSAWIKIGEFAVGQIQDGSVANTLPIWDTTDLTWKQNSGLTLSGTAITGTAATALSITAASGQDVTIDASGSGGDITATSAAGSVAMTGSTTATVTAGSGTALLTSTSGAANVTAATTITLNAPANGAKLTNSATTDTVTGTNLPNVADVSFIRENVVLRKYNAALADAGTLDLAVGTGADISVKVVGSGANADKVYTSKITAGLLTATTVDSSEFGIVGSLSGVTIALAATASVITVTVTNGTGAAAAVSIQALPLN